MSIESSKGFFTRMNEDKAFKNKILAIEDIEARLACAKAEGFEFTREEMDGLAVEVAVGGQEGREVAIGCWSYWFWKNLRG